MKIALIQMAACPDVLTNLDDAIAKIREAVGQGAEFIATPENSDFIIDGAGRKIAGAYDEETHPFLLAFKKLARELNVTILLGSIAVKIGDGKLNNRSYLFAPSGNILASYNKIHLFDVDLPTGESRRESDMITAGDKAVMVDAGFAKIGMTICYDVRFPHLFRHLAKAGAEILTVPSAFTVPTGEMHWKFYSAHEPLKMVPISSPPRNAVHMMVDAKLMDIQWLSTHGAKSLPKQGMAQLFYMPISIYPKSENSVNLFRHYGMIGVLLLSKKRYICDLS